MPNLSQFAVVDKTKLTDAKQTDRFYSSHLVGTPEFTIPHDTKRIAEEPKPWWFNDDPDDDKAK